MEEELSENELEGRMFAMLHYADDTKTNVGLNQKDTNSVGNVTHSGKRYWHNNSEQNTPYQKTNTLKEPAAEAKKNFVENVTNSSRGQQYWHNREQNTIYQKINSPKEPSTETKNILVIQHNKDDGNNSSTQDLSIFQQPVSENIKKTVEILENDELNRVVELESSDEDEVIEVALPPKPTITIESSDEDTVAISIGSAEKKSIEKHQDNKTGSNRETASPVPSVVSSISDEFIRGDCIALNISSKHANNESFDFSLHGADLLCQTPTRKKKKKRNKDTSTPNTTPVISTPIAVDECFATPKSKAKNKRQRTKSYKVTGKSVPNPDVYDSDSNQSTNEGNKNPNPYSVTDKSLPNIDVYESDSNPLEIVKDSLDVVSVNNEVTTNSSSTECMTIAPKSTKKNNTDSSHTINKTVIDLTEPDITNSPINENIVMGNVTGFTNVDQFDENSPVRDLITCGSTKIPAILNEDLDFDNLKGITRVCKRRRYSLTTLRAEMEKFYNESWGGEEFNHREIQKNMSRDKNLWHIDPKDRMPSMSKRKTACSYCNRVGHRDDMCRMKPAVCFMCGSSGHFEPRCPRKICVNCGSPNYMYSTMCRNCSNWHTIRCIECGQNGHPASHCPDLWRRYHNTINLDKPLEENRQIKKHYQSFCSGCTRRGHFVHTCRISLPFSGLPINSPYVAVYRPVYSPICNNNFTQNTPNQGNKQNKRNVQQDSNVTSVSTPRNDSLKRQSKSPVNHDTHVNKKKNSGTPDDTEINQRTKSPINNNTSLQKKNLQNKEQTTTIHSDSTEPNKNKAAIVEENQPMLKKAPDFISISSENHDKLGQIIQDNEVSDTSDVVTSARIYIPNEIVEKLKTEEGDLWMKEAIKKNNVSLETDNITFYLSIKGAVGNQEAFQAELLDWIGTKHNKQRAISDSEADVTQESITEQSVMSKDIPKNRNNVLRKLNRAFETLKSDLGDPMALYRELVYLQNRHQQLLKQKFISPQQLSNNKNNINTMLKKLNMVLLGQAGLADGLGHITALHVLQEKLINFRQKHIPTTMREKIDRVQEYKSRVETEGQK
ncbi:jg13579 [Pararge aegeria aegeria]|uniref:Zinc finger CCHC domain-containing protein 7 n=1 Tax=Pararge aegeria aegeria TaxID=348720 RepID=A0A8S4QZB2_9NEOP|nr:jg13579 [Pararge aegeria aegeria]